MVQPPKTGSIDIRVIVPPVIIAYVMSSETVDKEMLARAYKYCMTEFMPADGEEFERDNHHSCAWDGPQTEEHYRINNYLYLRLEHIEVGED